MHKKKTVRVTDSRRLGIGLMRHVSCDKPVRGRADDDVVVDGM